MKQTLLLCACLLFTAVLFAQTKVTGIVNDTTNRETLENSSVVLLHAKDSILYKFTRSDAAGKFSFTNVDTGKYILLVSQDTYTDYVDQISVTGTAPVNVGTIAMTLVANILQEVIVKQQVAAIRMRGDTTEFTADSFKVRPGASVEEMLRILPGLQVDKDGKITAQGQTVQKVLVDGEEFFGDDPTLATKNLQADAIDKVQVYDKKSDQAEFTGIDDGERTKTINLKLKADKKKGYFGKVDLASNLKDRWDNSAMINTFKKKYKISAYGIMSNTGSVGLNWDDRAKYGSADNTEYDEDGGFYITSSDDEFFGGNYNGSGLPKAWSAGLNYGNKWDDDKQNVNGSYRYYKLNTEGTENTISQSLLPGDNYFVNRENSYSYSSRQRHSASGVYEWQLDSSTSMKVTASGNTGTTFSRTNYASTNANAAGYDVNRSMRTTTANGDNQNLNANAILKKKFKKLGRTLSLNLNERYSSTSSKGLLKADIQYYDPKDGTYVRDSITNQLKQNDNNVSNFSAKAVYTEPLSNKVFVSVNYGFRSTVSESKLLSYDSTSAGKYEALNALYSNDYEFNNFTHTTGVGFSYNSKKLTASAGSDIGFTNFYQKDKFADTTYTRNYTNFFPKANINYKFNTNMRFSIRYNGSTQQPSITQIQPVKNNTNPLFETIGNASLKQAFRHNANANFSIWNAFKQRSIGIWSSYNATTNAIVSSQTLDTTTGKTTMRYINSNSGNYNYYASAYMYTKIKKLNLNMNVSLGFSGSKFGNIVNGNSNTTTNNSPSFRIGFNKYKEKKYSIWYNYSYNYNFSKSTIQSAYTTNYWTQNHSFGANVTLPWKLEINTDIDYDLRQKTSVFTSNNNVFMWNGYIGRRLLKNDKAIIKITAHDILNQNKGYQRNISSNQLTERTYQIIRRYFTLAFTWNFSKSAAGTPSNPSSVNP